MQATAELREELPRSTSMMFPTMVEAIYKMLDEKLGEEIAEFQKILSQLAEARAKYAVAMRENADPMKSFVFETLGKEIKELTKTKKQCRKLSGKLEEFVVEALTKEIAEFYEDKKDLAETKVRLVREAKSILLKLRKTLSRRVQN